ncbi:hypothetical protein GCM10007086_13460 [Photobacterium aphoticum]|nr:hypothetical protein GCM10007086_13460 [Photobacterium aphoticum]
MPPNIPIVFTVNPYFSLSLMTIQYPHNDPMGNLFCTKKAHTGEPSVGLWYLAHKGYINDIKPD